MCAFSISVSPLPNSGAGGGVICVELKCEAHTLDTGLVLFGIHVLFRRLKVILELWRPVSTFHFLGPVHTLALFLTLPQLLFSCCLNVWMLSCGIGTLFRKNPALEKRLEGSPFCFNRVPISRSLWISENKVHRLRRLASRNLEVGFDLLQESEAVLFPPFPK